MNFSVISNSSNLSLTTEPDVPEFALFVWPIAVMHLIGGVGSVFGNFMILGALVESPELRKNRCNMFVGNLALADVVSSAYFIYYGLESVRASLSGLRSVAISNELCFYINIPALVSFDAGSLIVLAIGIDRMVSLNWPIYYKNLTQRYVILANGAAWVYGLSVVIAGWMCKDPNSLVISCVPPNAVRGLAFSYWNDSNIVINVLVVAAYGIAYRKAKKLASVSSRNNDRILRNNKLLTSLVICVSIYTMSWVVTMLVVFSVTVFQAPLPLAYHCIEYVGITANINVGCNFYVYRYYARSDDYRRAFRKMFGYKAVTVIEIASRSGENRSIHNRSIGRRSNAA